LNSAKKEREKERENKNKPSLVGSKKVIYFSRLTYIVSISLRN
jgi:hypothetical protein